MDKSPEFEIFDENLTRDLLAFAEKFPGGTLADIDIAPEEVRDMYKNLKSFIETNSAASKEVRAARAKLKLVLENPFHSSAEFEKEQIDILIRVAISFQEYCPKNFYPTRKLIAWNP